MNKEGEDDLDDNKIVKNFKIVFENVFKHLKDSVYNF